MPDQRRSKDMIIPCCVCPQDFQSQHFEVVVPDLEHFVNCE